MMSYKFPKRVLALLIGVGLAIAGSHAPAQSVSGSISGTVTDPTGADCGGRHGDAHQHGPRRGHSR